MLGFLHFVFYWTGVLVWLWLVVMALVLAAAIYGRKGPRRGGYVVPPGSRGQR